MKDKKVTLKVWGRKVVVTFDAYSDEVLEGVSGAALRERAKDAVIDLLHGYGESQSPAAMVRFSVEG